MELRQLKYFVRIVELGSVSRASQSLHVAQPALSKQISRLEEELGVKLLARSVRGVTATEAGAAIYQQAQLILKQVEATQLIATQSNTGPAGPVAIGLPWTVTSLLGLSLLQEVRQNLKGIRLEIVEGPSSMLAGLLAQGKLDLAVLFDNTTDGGLLMNPLFSESLLLVGPRGTLADAGTSSVIDAAARPLFLLSRPNGIREEVERLWAAAGVKPNVIAEINAPHLLVQAVEAGLGFSVLPACGIEEAVRDGRLDAVELEGGKLQRTVFLSTSRLFSLSRAAEHVHGLVERLIRRAVCDGTWRARLVHDLPI